MNQGSDGREIYIDFLDKAVDPCGKGPNATIAIRMALVPTHLRGRGQRQLAASESVPQGARSEYISGLQDTRKPVFCSTSEPFQTWAIHSRLVIYFRPNQGFIYL